jgi:hypothetical protein
MIDIKKTYKTRDGREVRIYVTDCGGGRPVHGAFWSSDNRWSVHSWRSDGRINGKPNVLDLIEMKPRIQREVWVNVYDHACVVYKTKERADLRAEPPTRLACVTITIDCEEGDGL